jgi:hypothetical protein
MIHPVWLYFAMLSLNNTNIIKIVLTKLHKYSLNNVSKKGDRIPSSATMFLVLKWSLYMFQPMMAIIGRQPTLKKKILHMYYMHVVLYGLQ